MIGLVGHSGSGKSTLVNLICRFYDVAEGAVLIDGIDIRSVPVAEYRRTSASCCRNPSSSSAPLPKTSPTANRSHAGRNHRRRPRRHAHEFILRLPHGYDSLVGERGQGLSGGERQRISIARALLIDPILILRSHLVGRYRKPNGNPEGARQPGRGRTTIAIAHRLSTLRKANRLIVLDRGKIVELGNHDQLMAAEGHYYKLYPGAGPQRRHRA